MSRRISPIRPPTEEEIRTYAERHFIELTDEEIEIFSDVISDNITSLHKVDDLSVPRPHVRQTGRDPGYRPTSEEDPYNAFVTKCNIRESNDGPLSEYEVAVKDNISVAGVEMTCGSSLMEGYVPSFDATVVARLLDAGVTIRGKNNMESMASSGSGELSAFGPVLNPRNSAYLAGGSSSGSAAAVVTGDVDIAIGTDQGGSIRIPAAWCGCIGLKPTFGLVPYSGAVGLGYTFDHIGPLAKTVEDCSRTLEVIAGKDSLDPRQSPVEAQIYSGGLRETDPSDITVGTVEEGFNNDSESTLGTKTEVTEAVRKGLDEFADEGVQMREKSIPWHTYGQTIRRPISIGETTALIRNEGMGHFVKDQYDTEFLQAFAKARRSHANDLPPTMKLTLVLGEYLDEKYFGYYYAKTQNLRRQLKKKYDDALSDVDVLAMPTTLNLPHKKKRNLTLKEIIERAHNSSQNTAPFNITGHPAITVPCATVRGLPIGLMFVGDRFDDRTVLEVAATFERTVDWLPT